MNQWLAGAGGSGMGRSHRNTGNFGGSGNVLYLDRGSGYAGEYNYKNTSNHVLKKWVLFSLCKLSLNKVSFLKNIHSLLFSINENVLDLGIHFRVKYTL